MRTTITTLLMTLALALPSTAEWGWYSGDTHCHTDHSDGGLNQLADFLPRDVTNETWIQVAKQRGLDWLVISDHRTLSHYYNVNYTDNDLLLIPGPEWGGSPHGVMIGLHENIGDPGYSGPDKTQATAYHSSAHNALFAMSHPADDNGWWTGGRTYYEAEHIDLIEVWSVGPFWFSGDANRQAIQYWDDYLNEGRKITGIGASDTHFQQLDFVAGVGRPTTHVYARDLTQNAIIEGLRNGRVYMTAENDTLTVEFTADADRDGQFESMIGDILQTVHPDGARMRVRLTGAQGHKLQVYHHNGQLFSVDIDSNDFTHEFDAPNEKGWYRLEVGSSIALNATTMQNMPVMNRLAQMQEELAMLSFLSCEAGLGQIGCITMDIDLLSFLANPLDTDLEINNMQAMTNPIFIEPDPAVPTWTPRPTYTPTPTPVSDSRPRIMMAGYLRSIEGERPDSLIALIDTSAMAAPRFELELLDGFATTDLELADNGASGDFDSGDTVYGILLDDMEGIALTPGQQLLLGLRASPQGPGRESYWPWLTVY